jgi:putative tryptophan/tyrosine transport system substrate-binding protein
MMKRREFITLVGSAAAVWPLGARAQDTGKVARIGFIGPAQISPPPISFYQAFLAQMRELGFRDGQNLRVEYRAIEDPRGLSVGAEELVRSQPELIVASGPEVSLRAVAGASGTIPIVMIAINFDPIARGYVASLARPGGNITGVVFQQLELAQKQVEVLAQANPGKTRVAILFDEEQTADQFGAAEQAAQSLNLQVQGLKLKSPTYDFDAAFQSATMGGAQMALVLSGPGFVQYRSRIAELAIQHRLPTMFIAKHYVETGGLMSYGVAFIPMWRRAADYAARILKGAKPADLPVEQATKFEMVVNLKTAKAIGVELPTAILLRADEVME